MTSGTSRTWQVLLLAALAALVVVVVLLIPGAEEPKDTGSTAADSDSATPDAAQVTALTDIAREAGAGLGTVVGELVTYLPPGAPPVTDAPADPATVADWRARVEAVRAAFGDPPSGGTEVNVARGALTGAVDVVMLAVSTYDDALRLPTGSDREAALTRASESLDLGLQLWSVAATQVDDANIDAGLGHQHVNLNGTRAPDSIAEGSDAQ